MNPDEISEKTNDLQRLSKRVALLNERATAVKSCKFDSYDGLLDVRLKGLDANDAQLVRLAVHRELTRRAAETIANLQRVAAELSGGPLAEVAADDHPGDLEG